MCEKFNDLLYDRYAAEKTDGLNFMLLYVYHNGRPILQILEAPGEHYYNPNDKNEPRGQFLPYIQNIINSKNRKIWIYLTEPEWKDREDRIRGGHILARAMHDIQLGKGARDIYPLHLLGCTSRAVPEVRHTETSVAKEDVRHIPPLHCTTGASVVPWI